jgi:hypothetical protein
MSRVVPAGIVMPLSTIVEHDFFKALAAAASVKMQEVAFLSTAVGTGVVLRSWTLAGPAATRTAALASNPRNFMPRMVRGD